MAVVIAVLFEPRGPYQERHRVAGGHYRTGEEALEWLQQRRGGT